MVYLTIHAFWNVRVREHSRGKGRNGTELVGAGKRAENGKETREISRQDGYQMKEDEMFSYAIDGHPNMFVLEIQSDSLRRQTFSTYRINKKFSGLQSS